jgi:hypothetical protein
LTVELLASLRWPAALLVAAMAFGLLISRRWYHTLLLLALQYVGVFVLTAYRWPLEMAAVKLVAGWMSVAILGSAMGAGAAERAAGWHGDEQPWPSGRIFRFFLAILMALAMWVLSPDLQSWLPGVPPPVVSGGMILIGMGLLHLGLTAQPFRVACGLLTVLAGFEVIYAAVESSVLVAALLALVNLGLALAGAYLLNLPAAESHP